MILILYEHFSICCTGVPAVFELHSGFWGKGGAGSVCVCVLGGGSMIILELLKMTI